MKETINIIGAGLSGRLLGYKLAKKGFRIRLHDEGSPNGDTSAAYAAAAMLSPMAEAVDATPLVLRLGKRSVDLWYEILDGIDYHVFKQRAGSLIVWHPGDEGIADRFKDDLLKGNDGKEEWENWDGDKIGAEEPFLKGQFSKGYYLPTEGQLDNRQVLDALKDALEEMGSGFLWEQMFGQTNLSYSADWTIDCRGIGAKVDWNNEGGENTLRGVRGEVARVYAPEITLNRPVRLLHPRYPLYIAPKEHNVFVIGATQIESDDPSEVSVRSGLELLSALYAVHPAFGEARILELITRLRPTLKNHDPEIRVNHKKKLMEINGLFRHGFLISPALTDVAVDFFTQFIEGKDPKRNEEYGMDCKVME